MGKGDVWTVGRTGGSRKALLARSGLEGLEERVEGLAEEEEVEGEEEDDIV